MSGLTAGAGSTFTCKHLMQGAPDCVFCHRDQLAQEIATLRSDLTAARMDMRYYRNRCQVLAQRHYWPSEAPREAVAGDIGWTE